MSLKGVSAEANSEPEFALESRRDMHLAILYTSTHRLFAPSPLRRSMRDAICDHYLRLDPEDRYARFGEKLEDAGVRTYCDGLAARGAVVIAAIVDGEIRAMAELVPLHGGPCAGAEIAYSVERAFRNRGIASRLIRAAIRLARSLSIPALYLAILAENLAGQRAAAGAGFTLTGGPEMIEGVLPLKSRRGGRVPLAPRARGNVMSPTMNPMPREGIPNR
jgi:RimJ/RimL family protein N-acetyltransferase